MFISHISMQVVLLADRTL